MFDAQKVGSPWKGRSLSLAKVSAAEDVTSSKMEALGAPVFGHGKQKQGVEITSFWIHVKKTR